MLLARGHGWFVVVLDPLVQVRGGGRGGAAGPRAGCLCVLCAAYGAAFAWGLPGKLAKIGVYQRPRCVLIHRPGRAGEAEDR